jgi:hypothetical protein
VTEGFQIGNTDIPVFEKSKVEKSRVGSLKVGRSKEVVRANGCSPENKATIVLQDFGS